MWPLKCKSFSLRRDPPPSALQKPSAHIPAVRRSPGQKIREWNSAGTRGTGRDAGPTLHTGTSGQTGNVPATSIPGPRRVTFLFAGRVPASSEIAFVSAAGLCTSEGTLGS